MKTINTVSTNERVLQIKLDGFDNMETFCNFYQQGLTSRGYYVNYAYLTPDKDFLVCKVSHKSNEYLDSVLNESLEDIYLAAARRWSYSSRE